MSSNRVIMKDWVLSALKSIGGEAKIVEIAKVVWEENWPTIEKRGDMLYTWQYDMRWAADILRREGHLRPTSQKKNRGVWEIT